VYYSRVIGTLYNRIWRFSRGYRHFNSRLEWFYRESDNYQIVSVNNHAIDLERFDHCRISRFIRDPRDLVVSGYFYHKRGAEHWCNIVGPAKEDWEVVNGSIPEQMGKDQSFATYLQGVNKEDGLIAEIDFRANHFNSMLQWPTTDPRIKLFRYEDIIGNEQDVFADIFLFYGLSWLDRKLGMALASRFSAERQTGSLKHIRNPTAGQWKDHFTPKVSNHFERRYGELLERYGYE
jgi:hypothetical protein